MKQAESNSSILLDSHVILWLLYKPLNISEQTKNLLKQAAHVNASVVTIWELAIKHKKGKLRYPPSEIRQGITTLDIPILSCTPDHAVMYGEISLPHKDPFDTMLLAQAKVENLTLLTADKQLIDSAYPTIGT